MTDPVERVTEEMIYQLGKGKAVICQLEERIEKLETESRK